MPSNYNVSAAAAVVGVSPSTLRNWLKQYAKHLSDGATPPPGQDRVLNDADVAKLQFVKAQRDLLRDYPDIAKDLEAMPVDEAPLMPYIDLQPIAPAPAAPEPQPAAIVSTEVVQALQSIAKSIVEARHDDLQQQINEMKQRQVERYQSLVIGILIGAVAVLLVLGILALGQ